MGKCDLYSHHITVCKYYKKSLTSRDITCGMTSHVHTRVESHVSAFTPVYMILSCVMTTHFLDVILAMIHAISPMIHAAT